MGNCARVPNWFVWFETAHCGAKVVPIARSLGATIDNIIYGATGRGILTNCYLLQFYKFLDINYSLQYFDRIPLVHVVS